VPECCAHPCSTQRRLSGGACGTKPTAPRSRCFRSEFWSPTGFASVRRPQSTPSASVQCPPHCTWPGYFFTLRQMRPSARKISIHPYAVGNRLWLLAKRRGSNQKQEDQNYRSHIVFSLEELRETYEVYRNQTDTARSLNAFRRLHTAWP
jgi:hypothetical protein